MIGPAVLHSSSPCRPYLAGCEGAGLPRTMAPASNEDCKSYRMSQVIDISGKMYVVIILLHQETDVESLGSSIRDLVRAHLRDTGALLVRGLDTLITTNRAFSRMVDRLGDRFAYTAGFATRKEFEDAPGDKWKLARFSMSSNKSHVAKCSSVHHVASSLRRGGGSGRPSPDHDRAAPGDVLQQGDAR